MPCARNEKRKKRKKGRGTNDCFILCVVESQEHLRRVIRGLCDTPIHVTTKQPLKDSFSEGNVRVGGKKWRVVLGAGRRNDAGAPMRAFGQGHRRRRASGWTGQGPLHSLGTCTRAHLPISHDVTFCFCFEFAGATGRTDEARAVVSGARTMSVGDQIGLHLALVPSRRDGR